MWVLLVLSTYAGQMPDNVALQDFSSKSSCEAARAWVQTHQARNKMDKIEATCLPK